MARRHGSLADLLPPKADQSAIGGRPLAVAVGSAAKDIPLTRIGYNPFNPRESHDDVAELAASLTAQGQLQAAAVVTRQAFLATYPDQADNLAPAVDYIVVDGNRRRRAAEVAGLTTLRSIVDDSLVATPARLSEAALVANIQRKNFEPLEEAKAVEELVAIHGNASRVAERLGKSKGWVSQRRALLGLLPEFRDLLRSNDGVFTVEQARAIGRHSPEEQRRVVADLYRRTREPAGPEPGVDVAEPPADNRTSSQPGIVIPAARAAAAPMAAPAPDPAGLPGERARTARIRLGTPGELVEDLVRHLERDDLIALVDLLIRRVGR